jgi:hypothetical protein
MTQAINTMMHFGGNALKPGAKVPELHIEGRPQPFSLVGDRHTGGRSSSRDITIRNETVSANHFFLRKDTEHPRHFVIQDDKSSNGIYVNNRKVKNFSLRNGDTIHLAPPELAQYHLPLHTTHLGTNNSLWANGFRWLYRISVPTLCLAMEQISPQSPPFRCYWPCRDLFEGRRNGY